MSWPRAVRRFVHLNVGLALFGVSVAAMVAADVGVGPWDVFHTGLALRTPLSLGAAMVVAGLSLLLVSAVVAGVRPGVGTVMNMAVIGPWTDLFLSMPWFPSGRDLPTGLALFVAGMVLNGVATGVYLSSGLGAGPRDGFALSMARLAGAQVRRTRTVIELIVLATGWLLGGAVGLGTIVFALAIGPLMQAGIRWTKSWERAYDARA